MKGLKRNPEFGHSGPTFDSFLEKEGIRGEVEAVAVKRVLAWQLERAMQKQHKTKQDWAGDWLFESRTQKFGPKISTSLQPAHLIAQCI
jgi:hypothetical protein